MLKCTDCIHFKACEDWAKSFCSDKETTFPYEAESNLCEYYEPVIHGKWIGRHGRGGYDDYKCSVCGVYDTCTSNPRLLGNYCPNCGVKMDKEN